MKIDVLTIFPEMFKTVLSESIMGKAQEKKIVEINVHDLRKWSADKHKSVDDKPFGGGPGMVMMVEPVYNALKELRSKESKVVLMSAKGENFSQARAKEFSKDSHLIFICPHYEGIDQRVVDNLVDEVVSIGPYILTGGELPAMVVIDSATRLIPGVVGKEESVEMESHSKVKVNGREVEVFEYPQYTQPAEFKVNEESWKVPEVLLSGDHEKIKAWRIANLKITSRGNQSC